MDKEQETRQPRRRRSPSEMQAPQPRQRAQHTERPSVQAEPAAGAPKVRPARPDQPQRAAVQPDQPRRRPARPEETRQQSAQQAAPRQRPAQSTQSRKRPAQERNTQSQHPAAQRSILLGGPHMRSAKRRTAQEQRDAKKLNMGSGSKEERTLKKNSLASFISGVRGEEAKAQAREERAKERQKKRAAQEAKRRRQAQRDNTPAVIYTQPAAFNRNRLFMQLLTITAVVLALVMALSVFFKVKTITVSGADVYSPWSIREASGIEEGDNLLTFSRARAGAQIRAALPYVDKVRIGIKLPETVIIYIEELSVAYAIKSSDGDWWLINSDGRVVEQVDGVTASKYTQVLGVTITEPKVNENAVATEFAPTETDASGEPIPVMVTGAQRLFSAMQILKALEANDIVGTAASVDVSMLESIVLWYGTRYQVNLGDTSRMEYKVACMNDTILQLSEYQSGILDISFTIWPNQVGYTPFT